MELEERNATKIDSDIPRMIFRTVEIAALKLQQGSLTATRAEDLIRQMLRNANPEVSGGSFRKFAASWLDQREVGIEDSTATAYRNAVKYANRSLGSKSEGTLHKITVGDVEKIQADLVAMGLRSKTINHHVSVLRRILRSAVDKDLISKNPATTTKGRPTGDSKRRAPFSVDEWRNWWSPPPATSGRA